MQPSARGRSRKAARSSTSSTPSRAASVPVSHPASSATTRTRSRRETGGDRGRARGRGTADSGAGSGALGGGRVPPAPCREALRCDSGAASLADEGHCRVLGGVAGFVGWAFACAKFSPSLTRSMSQRTASAGSTCRPSRPSFSCAACALCAWRRSSGATSSASTSRSCRARVLWPSCRRPSCARCRKR